MENERMLGSLVRRGKRAYRDAADKAASIFGTTKKTWDTLDGEYNISERVREIRQYIDIAARSSESIYGIVRQKLIPERKSKTPRALLANTRDELIYVIACVLQISPKNASKWAARFGDVLAAKLAAAGVTTSLLGLVATFGTAGTGTAITTLSGAAATSATMAWVGGIIGGGMVAGTFLTAGVALGIGYAVYKTVGSQARAFEDLTDIDKGVVETCSVLSEAIGEAVDRTSATTFSAVEADLLYRNALLPLFENLVENSDDICSRLDKKNAVAFRQHVIKDYERIVIQGFSRFVKDNQRFIRWNSAARVQAVIGGVIYALLSRNAVGDDVESQLVLAALRRSTNDLEGASELEVSEYLSTYSPDQIKGIANNVKGIYHELLFVHDYNETHDDTFAELFGATNNPGADVQIRDVNSNEVLEEFQLKATNSAEYAQQHVEKYPDIDLRTTEEIAERVNEASPSGYSNDELTLQVAEDTEVLVTNTIGDQMTESLGLIGVIAAGREAIELLNGRRSPGESARSVVGAATVGAAATGITAFLFS